MRFNIRFLLIFFLTASLAVTAIPLAAQSGNSRRSRLRAHEAKIQEIIRARRERQKEEEAERKAQEIKERREGVQEEEVQEEAPQRRRAASSVVMGFKYMNEDGDSAYNVIVGESETFVSEVYLFNIDQNPIERIRLCLDYDKRFIEPVRVFDTTIRSMIDGEPSFSIEDREGMILYDAKLAEEMVLPEAILLRILWKAHRPTPFTGIEFGFDQLERDDQPHTAIYCRGKNILGVADDPADGVLSGGLMIESPEEEEKILQGKAEDLKEIYLGSVASESQIGLVLNTPEQTVRVGDEFEVTVILNNPEGALVDALNFAVLFDPAIFQAIDRDEFNYHIRGVNIHDGPYHRNFPWDMHKKNEIRNDRGLAVYQMGLSNGASLPNKPLGSIYFRAIAPATNSSIGFVKGRPGAPDLTSIRYFGFERVNLGLELSRPSIAMTVLPAPIEVAAQPAEQAEESETVTREETQIRSLRIER